MNKNINPILKINYDFNENPQDLSQENEKVLAIMRDLSYNDANMIVNSLPSNFEYIPPTPPDTDNIEDWAIYNERIACPIKFVNLDNNYIDVIFNEKEENNE